MEPLSATIPNGCDSEARPLSSAAVAATGGVSARATPTRATLALSAATSTPPATSEARPQSPGQQPQTQRTTRPQSARGSSHGLRVPYAAWGEGAPSPRTPRGTGGPGGEYRVNIVLAELQRQTEADRRNVQRQLEHLERRQDQLSSGGKSERWAELQGSVSGLLEEMAGLSRRVESLDEKLRSRVSTCEEVVRQNRRELEQQIHTQQQKASLALSTSEEMSKRHAAKLRKLSNTVEEYGHRLSTLDDRLGDPTRATLSGGSAVFQSMLPDGLEARLAELEAQQANFEEDLRSLAVQDGTLPGDGNTSRNPPSEGEPDSILRIIERDVSRLTQNLDEHAASLASLRVRSDAQEQRLVATHERLESAMVTPLDSFRAEVLQLREHDRQETEGHISHLSRRLQALSDSTEDTTSEIRDSLLKVASSLQALEPREDSAALRKLMDTSVAQEQSIRRLETAIRDPNKGALASEDICEIFARVETLEHRTARLEQEGLSPDDLADKADRTEVMRVEAALQEFADPLRRLSQRAASLEGKAAALERSVEKLQSSPAPQQPEPVPRGATSSIDASAFAAVEALAEKSSTKSDLVAEELGVLRARLVDMESQVESLATREDDHSSVPGGSASEVLVSSFETLRRDLDTVRRSTEGFEFDFRSRLESLAEKVEETQAALTGAKEAVSRTDELSAKQVALSTRLSRLEATAEEAKEEAAEALAKANSASASAESAAAAAATIASFNNSDNNSSNNNGKDVDPPSESFQNLLDSISDVKNDFSQRLSDLQTKLETRAEESARLAEAALNLKTSRVSDELRSEIAKLTGEASNVDDLKKDVENALATAKAAAKHSEELEEQVTTLKTDLSGRQHKVTDLIEKLEEGEGALRRLQSDVVKQLSKLDEAQAIPPVVNSSATPSLTEDESKMLKALPNQLKDLQDLAADLSSLKTEESSGREQKISEILRKVEASDEAFRRLQKDCEEQLGSLKDAQKTDLVTWDDFQAVSNLPKEVKQLQELHAEEAKTVMQHDTQLQTLDQKFDRFDKALNESKRESAQSSETTRSRIDNLRVDHELLKSRVQSGVPSSTHGADEGASAAAGAEAVASLQSELKDLSKRLEEALERVEASEAATSAVREELMCGAPPVASIEGASSSSFGLDPTLERRVRELEQEVVRELDALKTHQQDLIASKSQASASAQQVESGIKDLLRQVDTELKELEQHQSSLKDAKPEVLSKQSTTVSTPAEASSKLEEHVAELHRQVAEELALLAAHQKDMGRAKLSLADVSAQLEEVRTMVSGSKQTPALARSALTKAPATAAAAATAAAPAASVDSDDSYDEDFEKSAEDAAEESR